MGVSTWTQFCFSPRLHTSGAFKHHWHQLLRKSFPHFKLWLEGIVRCRADFLFQGIPTSVLYIGHKPYGQLMFKGACLAEHCTRTGWDWSLYVSLIPTRAHSASFSVPSHFIITYSTLSHCACLNLVLISRRDQRAGSIGLHTQTR